METKRKDSCMDCETVALKKARYSWQVKTSNRQDISSVTDVVICDNVSSCQHCNSRKDKSVCKCNSAMSFERSEDNMNKDDMDCSVANVLSVSNTTNESHTVTQYGKNLENGDKNKQMCERDNNIAYLKGQLTPECFHNMHTISRTSSPASSSVNLSFDGQEPTSSEVHKDDGRTSISSFSNTTSMLALPSNASVDPEIEEEGLLISYRQREEELNLYLKRWQNQHIAKSIVDNAINKTLEEMGVSPEPQQFVSNLIESQGISEAIRLQGLIPQTHCNHMGPVHVLSDLAHSSNYFLPLTDTSKSAASAEQNDTDISTTSSELLDHAVSVAIGSKGLTFHSPGT